jgi:hypothetical protein
MGTDHSGRAEDSMDYLIDIRTATLDLPRVDDALRSFDPAAVADLDKRGGQLRIAANLSTTALVGVLTAAGLPIVAQDVHPQPSVCCGGCGG